MVLTLCYRDGGGWCWPDLATMQDVDEETSTDDIEASAPPSSNEIEAVARMIENKATFGKQATNPLQARMVRHTLSYEHTAGTHGTPPLSLLPTHCRRVWYATPLVTNSMQVCMVHRQPAAGTYITPPPWLQARYRHVYYTTPLVTSPLQARMTRGVHTLCKSKLLASNIWIQD